MSTAPPAVRNAHLSLNVRDVDAAAARAGHMERPATPIAFPLRAGERRARLPWGLT
ncbi:hypothetical protein [Lysobacter claricitrinus]|uniref:hypothetical protein n=1 Tax=Lysobacter claricitrinus TaxID=3367728 RepID=UPI0038B35F7A